MTNGDIFIQIISEATGQPKDHVRFLLDLFKKQNPKNNLDKELDPPKAYELLQALRKEKAGILNWLSEGYETVIKASVQK